MLTPRENMMETIKGGKPDRFVKQYEAVSYVPEPYSAASPKIKRGGYGVNQWGVTRYFSENAPAPIPVHNDGLTVCKDITRWHEAVKAPAIAEDYESWRPFIEMAEKIDRKNFFVATSFYPGIFENLHFLMGMEDTFVNFYEEPEHMHGLIDYIADWELYYAELLCKYIKPDLVMHSDDLGSSNSSFFSPKIFNEFFVPSYKRIFGCLKNRGVEVIMHHSDSYAANLVPGMIEMGVDIWQGTMSTNNIPGLIKKHGGQIAFMGGIDNREVDRPDWTAELIMKATEKACRENGKEYYIPATLMAMPGCLYPGVYEAVSDAIDIMSRQMF